MTSGEGAPADFKPTYRSGAAARLAGIPVETLRVWERRYRVVGPQLTARGHRLYSAEDVSRLALMKQLIDLGSSIGSIASLTTAALHEMRAAASAAWRGTSAGQIGLVRPVRVALVGVALTDQADRDGVVLSSLEIVATCAKPAGAAAALRGISADVLVMDLPALQPEAADMVDALVKIVGARHAAIAYRFGRASVVGELRDRGHTVTRAPLDPDELERICRDAINAPARPSRLPLDAVPGRRFDDQSLARLARSLTTLYCECPHHVVELLLSLGTFERYSAECANRSRDDALLHRYLERVAGSARVLFEDALVRIAQAEGFSLAVETQGAGVEA